ncbi:MAG: M50 family metallopeptidase [Christensenella sp.]|uniref:M50 family metallopeptidase n=1 Tax=Christensenella sp. TaxID=1935934 RepID=UPI002B1FC157|nr:M50 family metallopeptidase [Christensenella sp.]MEA5002063.1 M50 family metallopeptidase [Christensenella sp.]
MQIVLSIIVTLLVLTGLVVAHEFGHYIVAKKNGIKVTEFAIGFGPKLIKWYRNGTEFSIRPFFVGGFNKFADDEEKDPEPGDFRAASLKSRFLTIIAGPAMNILVAIILSTVILMTAGDFQINPNPQFTVQVQGTEQSSPAETSGILPGDVVRSMNGIEIHDNASWNEAISADSGDTRSVVLVRDGQEIKLEVPFSGTSEDGSKLIGMNVQAEPVKYNFFEAVGMSFQWLFLMMGQMFTALGQLFFMGQGLENMAGIVGVVQIVGQVIPYGLVSILTLSALLSVNLAIINLLPIPALDGGKIVLYAVEGIRKKPAPIKVEGILNLIGMVLVFGLAIFLVFQDVSRLVT